MRRVPAIALLALALAACGDDGDRKGSGQVDRPAPVPLCDWETQLWDGETCLARTDHESHTGG